MLSIVVPIHNEAETLSAFEQRLSPALDALGEQSEVILVDDGSTDTSPVQMRLLAERDPRYKLVMLSRNFGHQIAITAGLDRATGDGVIVMDGDLQDPPEVIPQLVERWREGYDVVFAIRKRREGEPVLRKLRAAIFYRFFRSISDIDAPVDVGDFRIIDRRVLEALRDMPERHRYIRGMVTWVGFRQTGIEYVREERFAGESKYTFRKLLQLGLDGVASFSNAPLDLVLRIGMTVSVLSLAAAVAAIGIKIAGLFPIPGTATIVVLLSFLGGIQLLMLGILGTYLGRIYEEVKARPLYFVDREFGFHPTEPDGPGRALR